MIKYVKVYHDLIGVVDELSDTEAGRLFKAILAYGHAGEVRALSGSERLVFMMIKGQMDRDRDSYTQTVERNRENGSKGGRPKKPTGFFENPLGFSKTQENPLKPKKSQDKDKDKDKESYTPARNGFIADDDAAAIMESHNRVFERAEDCGFALTTHTMDALVDLVSKHGVERMLAALSDCAEHGAKTLAYLRKVLEGKPKKQAEPEIRMQRLF